MNEWLQENLVCPRDQQRLDFSTERMRCPQGHTYPIADGIPVMLLPDATSTGGAAPETFRMLNGEPDLDDAEERSRSSAGAVDPYVQDHIVLTNGNLYARLTGKLKRYPIPEFRLRPSDEKERLLDLGCNWGRWSIAASRKGYSVVGVDPSLYAIRAARRVSRQLDANVTHVVADARFLPFRSGSFDVIFSYGVLQHFHKDAVREALTSIHRVLQPSGICLVQMAGKYGVRNLFQQLTGRHELPDGFGVRYWTIAELRREFQAAIGPASISADGYFALNIQPADADLLPFPRNLLVRVSEAIRKVSSRVRGLVNVADSVYVEARRRDG
jgi:SAM-dependent methyltransferase/uncharacterized protein YbaR (Trm112 family)